MGKKSRNRFDIIDVENLYSQWHPAPIIFLKKINQECALDILEKTEITHLNNSEYKNILNFTNSPECENILSRVEKEKNKEKFFEILKDRDKLHPRVFDRGYSIQELYDLVENTDYDGDSIPGILEDLDGDGDPRNDDTDGDEAPNFLDPDDDNDGVLTKDEGGADGDPTNDFNDPNNPTLPDYLNPDIK